MPTYRAQDLANRITNVFYIQGNGLPRETYVSTAVYNYRRGGGVSWASVRSSATGNVSTGVDIKNDFFGGTYTIARTGVQFSTDWGVVPVGMSIVFILDIFTLPDKQSLKIQAFKGTSTALTGAQNEFAIPLSQGLIPYSYEVEVDENNAGAVLYFNQTAINDFLANPDQNLFILGEYDYNNIAPTDIYNAGNSSGDNVSLAGQT
jgi:hypothetical protein